MNFKMNFYVQFDWTKQFNLDLAQSLQNEIGQVNNRHHNLEIITIILHAASEMR